MLLCAGDANLSAIGAHSLQIAFSRLYGKYFNNSFEGGKCSGRVKRVVAGMPDA